MTPLAQFARRGVYLLDAAGSLALGIALAVFAGPLAAAAGTLLGAAVLLGVGLALVPWAGFNLWIGTRRTLPGIAIVNVVGDALWVVASLLLLVLGGTGFTPAGAAAVAILAAGVGLIGVTKFAGLGRARTLA